VVTPPSTSLYDIFFHGKKPIVIDSIVPARRSHILTESDDNNQLLEATCRPHSVEEVLKLIESGDVPFNKELVNMRLREQVASEIARDSIRNILKAIPELRPTVLERQYRVRNKLVTGAFITVSMVLSYMRWFRGRLIRRVEQGALFDMTVSRMRWINQLVAK
jgi:hypothetical protein